MDRSSFYNIYTKHIVSEKKIFVVKKNGVDFLLRDSKMHQLWDTFFFSLKVSKTHVLTFDQLKSAVKHIWSACIVFFFIFFVILIQKYTVRYVERQEKADVDFNSVLQAVKAVKKSKMSFRKAAAAHKITKSSLARYVKKIDETYNDISKVGDQMLLKLLRSFTSFGEMNMVKIVINNLAIF